MLDRTGRMHSEPGETRTHHFDAMPDVDQLWSDEPLCWLS